MKGIIRLVVGLMALGVVLAGPKKIVMQEACGVMMVVDTTAKTSVLTTTFHLDELDGGLTVTVPGRIAVGADGRLAWTSRQLDAIAVQLAAAGRDVSAAMPGVLLLEAPGERTAEMGDGPTPFPRTDTPLRPKCGKCKSGKDCTVRGGTFCCKDSVDDSCMICKVCSVVAGPPSAEPVAP